MNDWFILRNNLMNVLTTFDRINGCDKRKKHNTGIKRCHSCKLNSNALFHNKLLTKSLNDNCNVFISMHFDLLCVYFLTFPNKYLYDIVWALHLFGVWTNITGFL